MSKKLSIIDPIRMKEAMESVNISQTELSEFSGIPRTTINQLLTGRKPKTSIERIEKIAKILKVSSFWLQGQINIKRTIITSDDVMLNYKYIMDDDEIFSLNQDQDRLDLIECIKKESRETDLSFLLQYFDELKTIDKRDYDLLIKYNSLSKIGKERCDQYIDDLLKIREYAQID